LGHRTSYFDPQKPSMPHENAAPPDAVACPICGHTLRRTGAGSESAFECERCGSFPDFDGGLALTPVRLVLKERRRGATVSRVPDGVDAGPGAAEEP
jgi:hypothetical protein